MARLLRTGLMAVAVLMIGSVASAQLINELLYDSVGTDAGTFTEIIGEPGTDLDGWSLVGVNGNGGVEYRTVPLTGVIGATGYFVVAQDSTVANADLIDPGVDWQNGADQVVLRQGTIDIDSVCYGFSPDLICQGDPAEDVPGGTSLARCPDGSNTGNNADDFVGDTSPTPGEENDADCGGPGEPEDVTLCMLRENDADGVPVLNGARVRVMGVQALVASGVFREPGSGLDIAVWQESDGRSCCVVLFDFNYDTLAFPIQEGDVISELVGTVGFFNGTTQIGSIEILTIDGNDPLPEPIEVTSAELAINGELYESCLIEICGLSVLDTGDPWPPVDENANVDIDDGSGPTIMRVDRDTDIDGSAAPLEPFTSLGLGSQFDSSGPYDSGYQIKPRRRADILDGEDCGSVPTIEKTWGQIKDRYR